MSQWGVFGIPEFGVLGDVAGLDVVELGCGTAYFSAKLARRGARVVGVDPTPAQLETARRMQAQTGIEFPLVEAPGEDVPLPDASFDLAFSEYGASLWADPKKWIAEAARLLRPGGRLVFLTNSMLAHLCTPDWTRSRSRTCSFAHCSASTARSGRSIPASSTTSRTASGSASCARTGSCVDALHELRPGDDAQTHHYYFTIPVEWARRWPGEDLWEAHLR